MKLAAAAALALLALLGAAAPSDAQSGLDAWTLTVGAGSAGDTRAAFDAAKRAAASDGGGPSPTVIGGLNPGTLPCITSPVEYGSLFYQRAARCTSGLVVRLSAVSAGTVPTSWYAAVQGGATPPSPFYEAEKRMREGFVTKAMNFLGAGDQTMKYLAIGNPQTPKGTLTQISNGLSLLEQIGYQLADADITQVAVLAVLIDPNVKLANKKTKAGFSGSVNINGTVMKYSTKPTLPANNKKFDGPLAPWPQAFPPTWTSLLTYLSTYAKTNHNLDLNGGAAALQSVGAALQANDFSTLSGCPNYCVFEDLAFPDPTGFTYFPPANTPVRLGIVDAGGTCVINEGIYPAGTLTNALVPDPYSFKTPPPLVPRLRRVMPDAVNPWSDNCTSPAWLRYRSSLSILCPSFTDLTGNLSRIFNQFASFWNEGVTDTDRANLVRAFLISSCMGNFNALFSGNGMTYTGTGGFYAPLGQELVVEQMTPVKPYAPITPSNGPLPRACAFANDTQCYNGLPYVGGPCTDVNGTVTQEGVLCNRAAGLSAVFLPICLNGNTPNTNTSSYPNNDPNYACFTSGRACSNGAICCSPHCTGWAGNLLAYDPSCQSNTSQAGCVAAGGNCRKCRYLSDGTADASLPVCPRCLCAAKRQALSDCTPDGF